MHARRTLARIFALGLTAALAAASPAAPADAQPAPIDIDVLLSLTGPGGFAGAAQAKSLATLESAVNARGGVRGRSVHFVIHDDQTSPAVAVQLMNAAIARKPAVVLGPSFAALCNATLPMVANGPVDYCLSPSLYPPRGSYAFSNGPSQADLVAACVRYFRDRGIKRIAAITTTDATGQDADKALIAEFGSDAAKAAGLTLVAHEHYAVADLEVSAQIARIKSATPGAVINWTSGTAFGTFLRGLQQSGLDVPVGAAPSNMTRAQMTQYAAILPRELYFSGVGFAVGAAPTRGARAQIALYGDAIKAAGIAGDYQTGLAWDPGLIVIEAFRKYGPDATAAQVHDFIENLRGFNGISGTYDFTEVPQRGVDIRNLLVMRWDAARDGWIAASKIGGGLL